MINLDKLQNDILTLYYLFQCFGLFFVFYAVIKSFSGFFRFVLFVMVLFVFIDYANDVYQLLRKNTGFLVFCDGLKKKIKKGF